MLFEKLPQAGHPLLMQGVIISVRPTVRVRVHRPRGKDLIGALVVDTAKGILPKTDDAAAKLTNGMIHAATLLHRQVNEVVAEQGLNDAKVSPDHCVVFHTHRQQRVTAPTNSRKLIRNIEAVCRGIARGWDNIDPPPNFDAARARYRG
jgi:hypothetical protein